MTEIINSTVRAPVRGPAQQEDPSLGLAKFVDPLRIPPVHRPRRRRHGADLTVDLCAADVRLHSQLPPTPMWTFDGHFPGPTIEVRRGQRVQVRWRNQLTGSLPLVAVEVEFPFTGPQNGLPQPGNRPGRDGAQPNPLVAAVPPWTVVHLHGAHTNAGNDGLSENAILPGGTQLAEYPNNQQATALWYHDHAMDITRLTVMSGLLGMYLIRDDEEDRLDLPSGRYEVPLILCDRNLDTTDDGTLTGGLLHKIAALDIPGRPLLPFYGPYTAVNGVIWPYLEVEPRWYRFRMLNASNARIYRLFLLDENDAPVPGALVQIGTDSGLLPAPVPLDGELALAPAERADILVDFSRFRGTTLRLVSTGGGAVDVNPPTVPGQPNPAAGLVEPDVMQFRVRHRPVRDRFVLPHTLSPSFTRLTHDTVPAHEHRWLVLTPPPAGHLEMWEMAEVDPATVTVPSDGVVQVQTERGHVVTLQRVARRYEDAASFFVRHGGWEQWKVLNLGGPPHPIHIHLVAFQALSRDRYDMSTFDPAVKGTTAPVTYREPGPLPPNEQGWKDTIVVGPGDVVSVAARFEKGTGRFMYHCHILEHEDEGMMRPFVVMPEEVMALKPGMHGGGHGHPGSPTEGHDTAPGASHG